MGILRKLVPAPSSQELIVKLAVAEGVPFPIILTVSFAIQSKPLASEMAEEAFDVGDHVVPPEWTQSKLKACMSCSLVKTIQQFVQDGCDNCPFMSYEGDKERVTACTTSQFVGTYVVMSPQSSWVAKWQRVATFVPGAYAISIEARLPDDIVEQLEENRKRPHSVLATTDKKTV